VVYRVTLASLDLTDPASVEAFVTAWQGPLHILVNNAGVMATPETRTSQGWELQFATNHLGHGGGVAAGVGQGRDQSVGPSEESGCSTAVGVLADARINGLLHACGTLLAVRGRPRAPPLPDTSTSTAAWALDRTPRALRIFNTGFGTRTCPSPSRDLLPTSVAALLQ
jgi:NAD(P)-dependent dehydrogenase (short-subunit alcohol dehydrogenase family)